ncbi:hypothetical protein ACFOWE_31240 [Planomonospora corallina]|uniref:Uncharacterized protein n=1 Tax=Planomonospora corallina TaxID=1806052 RepID=A0ABV8IJZ6_9ACTN
MTIISQPPHTLHRGVRAADLDRFDAHRAEPMPALDAVLAYADAYRQLAGFLQERPDIAERAVVSDSGTVLMPAIPAEDPAAVIAGYARAARAAGARLEPFVRESYAGIRCCWWLVGIEFYAATKQVCRQIVTGGETRYELAAEVTP